MSFIVSNNHGCRRLFFCMIMYVSSMLLSTTDRTFIRSCEATPVLKGTRNRRSVSKEQLYRIEHRGLDTESDSLAPGLPKKRDCALKSKGSGAVEFECKSTDTDGPSLKMKDKIKFKVEASPEGASIKVEYSNKIDEVTNTRKRDRLIQQVEEEKGESSTNSNSAPNVDSEKEKEGADKENDPSDNAAGDRNQEDGDSATGGDSTKRVEDREGPADVTNSTETKTKYEIVYNSIIEYVKGNSSDLGEEYDFENDEVIQTIPISEWEDMSDVIESGNDKTIKFSVTTVDEMVRFDFTISSASSNSKITANKMKIDFTLLDFPWKQDNSHVAILSTVESERKVSLKRGPNVDEKSANGVGPSSVQGGVEGDNNPGINNKHRTKKTEKIEISFDDAVEAVDGFVSLGEYTWESTAKATKRSNRPSSVQSSSLSSSDVPSSFATFVPGADGSLPPSVDSNDAKDDNESDIQVVATSYTADEDAGTENDKDTEKTLKTKRETKQQIAFSFVGAGSQSASKIFWDPEAGISYKEDNVTAASSSSSSSPSILCREVSFIVSLLITGGTIFSSALWL